MLRRDRPLILQNTKINADFVSQVTRMGFDKEPFESLVKMRIFKINSEFIRHARADGVPLEVEKLVGKRIGVWGK